MNASNDPTICGKVNVRETLCCLSFFSITLVSSFQTHPHHFVNIPRLLVCVWIKLSCILGDGRPCLGNIVRDEGCDLIPVTLMWRYCNKHDSLNFIPSQENGKCYTRFNNIDADMDKSPLPPNQCKELHASQIFDTCRDDNFFDIRIEGELEDGSAWCFSCKTFFKPFHK